MSLRLGLAVAFVAALVDQAGKAWVIRLVTDPPGARIIRVTPFLNFAFTLNHGLSFGLFNTDAGLNAVLFTIVAGLIIAALLVWLARTRDWLMSIAIGLVVGGAVGNVIDRLTRGAVVDFIDFHIGLWHWFVFNLADAAITIGVGLMLIDSLRGRREARN
ncbi:MAG TPA: signal peptidase II [Stellaceae bacterium]|nr:signal peptidase II [Stellaceae bacterium]